MAKNFRTTSITLALSKYLKDFFLIHGLTMKLTKINKDDFYFTFKETHLPLTFHYDGFGLEIFASYKSYCFDLIPMIGIPFAKTTKNGLYALWLNDEGDILEGPYKSKLALIKAYIDEPLTEWLNLYYNPQTEISLHHTEGCSWARLKSPNSPIKLSHSIKTHDKLHLVRTIPLWKQTKVDHD